MPRLSWAISLIRLGVMPSARAASACDRSRSSRNARNISRGDVGGRCVGSPYALSSLVMVVATPHLLGRVPLPTERDAVLVVDADAVPAIARSLEPVAGRLGHVADNMRPLQLVEQPARTGPERLRKLLPCSLAVPPVEQVFSASVREGPYHRFSYYTYISGMRKHVGPARLRVMATARADVRGRASGRP